MVVDDESTERDQPQRQPDPPREPDENDGSRRDSDEVIKRDER
jgi:hypothetical protein